MFLNLSITELGLLATTLIFFAWIIRLEIRIRNMRFGKDSKTLEDSLISIATELATHRQFRDEVQDFLKIVNRKLKRSVQAVRTVRFNPFAGTGSGGNQSFATALIDEEGNGVVVSSLYSRDRVSVFAKPLVNHNSEYELSEEEKRAVEEAIEKIKN